MPRKTAAFLPHEMDAQPLVDFLCNFYPVSGEVIDFLHKHAFRKKLEKGKYLLKAGELCNHYYYIHKGVLRAFMKYGKKEITIWINPENEITTSIRSIRKREPSEEYIQAIEDCDLVALSFEDMHLMYERFPEMNKVGRILLEEYYAESEERVYISRIPAAVHRYQHFINSRPELVNRIPLKHVASYLGITLETLSRLRARKANKSPRQAEELKS